MPSYLTAALRHDSFHAMAQRAQSSLAVPSSASWPVNEIVLQSLVLGGKNDSQIAAQFGVSVDEVSGLRQSFDL